VPPILELSILFSNVDQPQRRDKETNEAHVRSPHREEPATECKATRRLRVAVAAIFSQEPNVVAEKQAIDRVIHDNVTNRVENYQQCSENGEEQRTVFAPRWQMLSMFDCFVDCIVTVIDSSTHWSLMLACLGDQFNQCWHGNCCTESDRTYRGPGSYRCYDDHLNQLHELQNNQASKASANLAQIRPFVLRRSRCTVDNSRPDSSHYHGSHGQWLVFWLQRLVLARISRQLRLRVAALLCTRRLALHDGDNVRGLHLSLCFDAVADRHPRKIWRVQVSLARDTEFAQELSVVGWVGCHRKKKRNVTCDVCASKRNCAVHSLRLLLPFSINEITTRK